MLTNITSLKSLARAADKTYGATCIIRTDRGDGSAGPLDLTVEDILDEDYPDLPVTEVSEDDDPEAWKLAREAASWIHDLPNPIQVWLGQPNQRGWQAIYAL